MKKIKSYEQYLHEEINLKKMLPGIALAGSVATTTPVMSQDTTKTNIENVKPGNIPKLMPYQDLQSSLFTTKTISLPGKSKAEVKDIFMKWAETTLANRPKRGLVPVYLKRVCPCEKEDEMILDYVLVVRDFTKVIGLKLGTYKRWKLKVVAQFKDGELNLFAYEDGNAYRPAVGDLPAIPEGKYKFTKYTRVPDSLDEFMKNDNLNYRLHLEWQEMTKELVDKLAQEIR
jgi:hypothetical protein